jgi:hypothetical protein
MVAVTTDALPTSPTNEPSPEQTKRDARCIRCGYDLRGHDVGGRCPECGLKTHWSLKAPILLSQYPALWVAAVARGVKLLSAAYLVLFVMMILSVGGALAGLDWLLFGVIFLAGVMQVAGAWMLASSSRHWSEPKSLINRFVLRATPILLPIAAAGLLWQTFEYNGAIAGMSALALAISLIAPIAAFVRLRTVARMISDADLMEHASVVGGGFLTSLVAGIALYLFVGFTGGDARNAWTTLALFAVIIALLLFLLWGAFLMFCCIIDFSQAARIAVADWRNDEAGATPGSAT